MRRFGLKLAVLSLTAVSMFLSSPHTAEARHRGMTHAASHAGSKNHRAIRHVSSHTRAAGHVIQCVAFAKTNSDVVLRGNAADWWYHAAGVYARGSAPEAGSVLNFRATRRMPLGHVAVVKDVINSRKIIIDQSHWAQRGISRNVEVVDVSPENDWSSVRVELNGRSGTFGSIYPTYGFIYGRPSNGHSDDMMVASNTVEHAASRGALSHPMASTEVAEAPATPDTFSVDSPDRDLR